MSDNHLKTGSHGEVGVAGLIELTEEYRPRVHTVAPGVHGLIGYGLASSTLIEGENGCIVIDTGSTIDEAEAHQKHWRVVTDKPITTIIYTHFHYAKGTTAYLADNPDLVVWGHERVHENWMKGRTPVFPTYTRRIGTQTGKFMPHDGPDSVPNCGAGPSYDLNPDRYGYVRPTRTVAARTELVIEGIRVVLIPAVSDTDDTLTIWLPDREAVISNVMWGVFPNIGAIRGELFRDPTRWGRSVEDIAELGASAHLGTHGLPVVGKEAVRAAMTDYRDAIQFVYDQALRGINKGLSPQDLVEQVALPQHLADSPVLQQRYGEYEFALRGVYSGLMGWFGTDTVELKPTARSEYGRRLSEAMGGAEKVLACYDQAIEDQDWQWAAEVVNLLWVQDQGNADLCARKARAVRELGHRSGSAITRNYYLTQARELEGVVDTVAYGLSALSVEKVLSSEPEVFIDYLRYQLDASESTSHERQIVVTFTDRGPTFALTIANSVFRYVVRQQPVDSTENGLRLTYETWARLLAGEADLSAVLDPTSGLATISGEAGVVEDFLRSFDTFNKKRAAILT